MRNKYFYVAAIIILSSCVNDDLDIGTDSSYSVISFSAMTGVEEVMSDNSNNSRSIPVDINSLEDFRVIAYMYDGISDNAPIIYFNEKVKKSDAVTWTTDKTYYWLSDASELTFIAIHPEIDMTIENKSGIHWINKSLPVTESQAVIEYTMPDNPADSRDLMLAVTGKMNNSGNGAKVPLKFRHLLSQVKFRIGSKMPTGTIHNITLKGIYTKGTYKIDEQTDSWINDGQTDDITITVDQIIDEIDSSGKQIGIDEQTLMALPQTLPDEAAISVIFTGTDGVEKELVAPISGTWTQGRAIEYLINITPDNQLFFDYVTKEPQDCHYVRIPITINSEKLPKGSTWTLESDQSWCTTRIGPLEGPENQGFWIISPESISGQLNNYVDYKSEYDKYNHTVSSRSGSLGAAVTAYVFMEENTGNTERTATLSLKVNEEVTSTATMTQLAPIVSGNYLMENIEEEINLPWGFNWDRVVRYQGNKGPLIGTYLLPWLYALGWNNQYGSYTGITILIGGIFTQPTIEINYQTMSSSTDAASHDDGQLNTYQLYMNAGGNTLGFENQITRSNQFILISETGSLVNEGNYAALTCVKKNAFPINITREQQGGDQAYTYAINFSKDRVNWYLPAEGQTEAFPETGNYWSSTAGETHANAFMIHNRIPSGTTLRLTEGLVRAVRNQ